MGLFQLCARLRAEVTSWRHQALFEAARGREPVLAKHADLGLVLEALERGAEHAQREELTRALVREHQRGKTSLWCSVLFVAFAPMLLNLRKRIGSVPLSARDVDQIVAEAFLVALSTQRTDARACLVPLNIRNRTYRYAFGRIVSERRHARLQCDIARCGQLFPDLSGHTGPAGDVQLADEFVELSALLRCIDDASWCHRGNIAAPYLRRRQYAKCAPGRAEPRECSRALATLRSLLRERVFADGQNRSDFAT